MLALSPVILTSVETGAGKTWFGCALARGLGRRGLRVVAVKPVESGCPADLPEASEDGVQLAHATGQAAPKHALTRLPAPVAPPEAADRAGRHLDFEDWVAQARTFGAGADLLLVEGAGGLLTPLSWTQDLLALGAALDARFILVAADRLGVLHHVRAALSVLATRRAAVLGVVLRAPDVADASTGSNAAALARLEPGTRLLTLPHAADPAALAEHVDPVVDWLLRP